MSIEKLYKKYNKKMILKAQSILKCEKLAEDVLHEVFIKIYEKEIHCELRDKSEAHINNYLMKMVRNKSIDYLRKSICEKCNVEYKEEICDFCINKEEMNCGVEDHIHGLKKEYCDILKLKYLIGYSNSEIQEILDISNDNLRQRLFRAKNKLKKSMEKDEHIF